MFERRMNHRSKAVSAHKTEATVVNQKDCYYYYYSSCNKGDKCHFRHEPLAQGNETMCVHWLQGKCLRPHCNFKHLELKKNRSKIPCFHENQAEGCLKDHCPFLHVNKEGIHPRNVSNTAPSEPSCKEAYESRKLSSDALSAGHRKFGITSFMLAKALSEYSDFSTTLLTLFEDFKFDPTIIKKIVSENYAVFGTEGETITLRPFIKVCRNYVSEEGCDNFFDSPSPCQHLHLCREFVIGKCKNETCLLGHDLDTNQNKSVLSFFKLSFISRDIILKLFKTIVFKAKYEKERLLVCANYNTGNCRKSNCKDLHICLKFLAELCDESKTKCTLSHNLIEKGTIDVLKLHGLSPDKTSDDIGRTILLCPLIKKAVEELVSKETVTNTTLDKTIWSHDYEGNIRVAEICYKSVESFCPDESNGCPKLHSKFHFHWQVLSITDKGDLWINMPYDLVFALEKAYCSPSLLKTVLPPLDITAIQPSCRDLISLLKGKSKWEADFVEMKLILIGDNHTLKLRRLCTKCTVNPLPKPCVYLWYFLDKNNEWVEFGNVDSSKDEQLRVNVNSHSIEAHFKKDKNAILDISSSRFKYKLYVQKMCQINTETNVSRAVRRRPTPHLKEHHGKLHSLVDLPDYWDVMQSGERVKRVKLLPSSKEYKKVALLLQQREGNYHIENIERVQNPFFWRAFQNKIEEMKSIYRNDSSVNIQQLFHGTNPDTVPKICDENFDWRLHGSNVGQAYGRGTYFSPSATTSYGYAKIDASGFKYIFVAKVAVGTFTLGNSNMARPPINPQTNVPFDSTVDNQSRPVIIVKYDKQEYIPEYILTLK